MMKKKLPNLLIRNKIIDLPIIQGGMGIGLSGFNLAGSVAREGALGVLSSAALDRLVSSRKALKLGHREAACLEVQDAKKISGDRGAIGMNVMVALINSYEESVLGSMDGGVDAIISGAGLPFNLVEIAKSHPRYDDVSLIPIVSSGRAAELIIKKWEKHQRMPDAFVVEGPLAGGHVGWRDIESTLDPKNKLENLIKEVQEVCTRWSLNIPIIAAGGIYSHEDILQYLSMGCAGVQMGTRFLATFESGANEKYKELLVSCEDTDIELAQRPGSPCGMLFRVLKVSPFYQDALIYARAPKCDKGYLLNKGKCLAKDDNKNNFCICNGLMASAQENAMEKDLYTVGQSASLIKKIDSVKNILLELQGLEFNSRELRQF
jgi:nitronate monooxygenase